MDRVAIVTGASRGIGRATAIRLARGFSTMALVARTQEALIETADAVRAAGADPDMGRICMSHPPLPPFTEETAIQEVRAAEDAWNTRDPARVVLAYTRNSYWRNRTLVPRLRQRELTLRRRRPYGRALGQH